MSHAYQDHVYVTCSAILMYLMRARLFQSASLVWLCAWAWFFSVFHFSLNKYRPWFWNAFWMTVIFGLREKMRPDSSLERFLTWTGSLLGLRLAVTPFEFVYSMFGDKSQTFPFNIISPWWRLSKPPLQPAGKEYQPKNEPDLCEPCREFTSRSNLIMGSRFPITRLVEWHKVWTSLEELRASAESHNQPCHICKLMWYSVSETRRQEIWGSRSVVLEQKIKTSKGSTPSQGSKTAREKEQSKQPKLNEPSQKDKSTQNGSTGWFGIMVWEERPLTLYTYIQLFYDGVPVGGRLLAHRGTFFEKRKFSS